MIIARLYAAAYTNDINTAVHFINSIARPWTTLMSVGFDYGAHSEVGPENEGTTSYGHEKIHKNDGCSPPSFKSFPNEYSKQIPSKTSTMFDSKFTTQAGQQMKAGAEGADAASQGCHWL
nr:alpha/beta hydrolase fold protein [Tanacetum cinerariifolium]